MVAWFEHPTSNSLAGSCCQISTAHNQKLDNKSMNNKSKIIPFVDDTSIIIFNPKPTDFVRDINTVFKNKNEWFNVKISLKLDKTHFMQLITKNGSLIDLNVMIN
jgi:protein associated with RNAse G/E